jgi:hypothetical protein
MNATITRSQLATALALLLASLAADAAEDGRYGTPVGPTVYHQEVRLRADTRSVTVRRPDVVRFLTADGREFFWRFDTERPEVFPLSRIAPAGVSVPPNAMVYVVPEVPIAP